MKPNVPCHLTSVCKVSRRSRITSDRNLRRIRLRGYGVQAENSVFATSITIFLGGAGYFVRSLVNLGRIRQP